MRREIDRFPSSRVVETAAQLRSEEAGNHQKDETERDRDLSIVQRPAQHRRIDGAQHPHDERLDLAHVCGQQQGRQARRNRKCGEQGPKQSIAVRSRHWTEDLPFNALHGEERDECSDNDCRREQNRLVDLQSADEDEFKAIGLIGALV